MERESVGTHARTHTFSAPARAPSTHTPRPNGENPSGLARCLWSAALARVARPPRFGRAAASLSRLADALSSAAAQATLIASRALPSRATAPRSPGQITHMGYLAEIILWDISGWRTAVGADAAEAAAAVQGDGAGAGLSYNGKYLASVGGSDDNNLVVRNVANGRLSASPRLTTRR